MKPTIFYDGSCGLCKREIAHYQKLDKLGLIEWINIISAQDELKDNGIRFVDAMAIIHGLNERGEVVRGVDNFMMIWRKLPQYSWLARVISGLRLQPIIQWCYLHFANWRFKRRMAEGCEIPKDS
ncbi:MAG: putative DCC family thiol-disulfide oxidoreductase YuxK [Crocinitomicaceae bacterium]|jgi:predicted DCC family thiol-disulfide oxidoreductase YuxK